MLISFSIQYEITPYNSHIMIIKNISIYNWFTTILFSGI